MTYKLWPRKKYRVAGKISARRRGEENQHASHGSKDRDVSSIRLGSEISSWSRETVIGADGTSVVDRVQANLIGTFDFTVASPSSSSFSLIARTPEPKFSANHMFGTARRYGTSASDHRHPPDHASFGTFTAEEIEKETPRRMPATSRRSAE
jgi:hypothetical protein